MKLECEDLENRSIWEEIFEHFNEVEIKKAYMIFM